MKNRFVKSGLDLEAKMNELDQKAEKEKDVQDKTASLDKFLEELSADLLVMKNAVSLIDEGNHHFKKANEDFGNVLNKYENIIKESKQFVDDVTRIGITSNISEESMKEVGKIFDDHYKLLLDFRKELSEELRFRIDDFLDREKQKHRSSSQISTKICPKSCRIAVSGVRPKCLHGFLASSDSACL